MFFCRLAIGVISIVALTAAVVVAASPDPAPAVPVLPADMCIPDQTGTPIPPPDLIPTGVPLIMSNSPETFSGVYSATALYRTPITRDHFRVFYHHQNGDYKTLKLGIAITNPSSATAPVDIYVGRNCQMLPGESRSTVNTDPATAGSIALRNWFQSKSDDHYIRTIAPGKTHYILQDLPVGATVTGMYDFGVRTAGKSTAIPNVIVTVLACTAVPADPTVIDMFQPERLGGGYYRRGVFAHSNRVGRVTCDCSGISCLDLAGPHEGKWARPMKNEVEWAVGDNYGFNPGNYGVLYSMGISLTNPTDQPVRMKCILSMVGGPGFSNVTVDQSYCDAGKPLRAYGSWVFKDITIGPKQTSQVNLEFSLPGGSSGAHRLYFWPDDGTDQSVKTIEIKL